MNEKKNITVRDLPALVGQELGRSSWHAISQGQVNLFAGATGDYAWIHVDPERARTGPYGGTIAHGFLALSLVPALTAEAFALEGAGLLVNYGINRVRFPAPLKVGSQVQLTTTLNGIEDSAFGTRLALGFEIRVEGLDRPVAVGETVVLLAREDGA
jgi:acyl dehydratase